MTGASPPKRSTSGERNEDDHSLTKKHKPSLDDAREQKEKEKEEEKEKTALTHALSELDIGGKALRQLKDVGVTTIADLLLLRDDLKDGTLKDLCKTIQKQLYHLCVWYEDFYMRQDAAVQWSDHLTEDVFDSFVEELGKSSLSSESQTKTIFEHATSMLHEGSPGDLRDIPEKMRDALYAHVVHLTMQQLPESLVKECQFDVRNLITTCAKALFNLPTGEPYPKIQLVAGRTQSGKSYVKAVVQATCDLLRCPLIIIAKGVAESKDLSAKIARLLNQGKSEFEAWWGASGNDNRSAVIPDTAARINKKGIGAVNELRAIKPNGKFVVIVDECDAMYRTDERGQLMEQAYDELMNMRPALRIEISATPIPALLVLTELGHQVEMQELGTSEDYCGVTEMEPLQDEVGDKLFLETKTIKFNEGVPYVGVKKSWQKANDSSLLFPDELDDYKFKERESRRFSLSKTNLKFIPCTDDSVMKLYMDALSDSKPGQGTKQGVLLLDCTLNRVNTDCNIFQKAACVQNYFMAQGKQMAIVVFVGDGIHIRRPGFLHGRQIPNRKTVSEVIDQLDQELGLEMPIFVFGYSKMKRCISYRSEKRVPTHLVLNLGLTQSNESYIQAIGRATFNGMETLLHKNGFKHVTVLTAENDLKMARRYTNFVHEVSERLKGGATVDEVMEAKKKFQDECNFLLHSNRKTGQIKRLKTLLPGQSGFRAPTHVTTLYKDDMALRIMRAVVDLVKESRLDTERDTEKAEEDWEKDWEEINERGFPVKAIMCKYNSTYQDLEQHTIKRAALNKELTQLKQKAKIEKTEDGRWRAKNFKVLTKECGDH